MDNYEVLSAKAEEAGPQFDILSDKIKASEKRLKRDRAKRSVPLGFGAMHQQAKAQEVYTCTLLAIT